MPVFLNIINLSGQTSDLLTSLGDKTLSHCAVVVKKRSYQDPEGRLFTPSPRNETVKNKLKYMNRNLFLGNNEYSPNTGPSVF